MNCIRIVQVCFNFSSLELVLCLYTCTVHMYCTHVLYTCTVVPPIPPLRSPPPPQYRRPSSSPNFFFNGTAKFLLCHCNLQLYLSET